MAKIHSPKTNNNANRNASNNAIIPEDILAEMLIALPAASLASPRKSAMLAQLLRRVSTEQAGPVITRADTGTWINFAENVDMKILHDEGGTRSWLARFGPGGAVPAHIQTGDEEAIVLTGWCYLDDEKICAGDYHRIGMGARHGNIVSPEGCLIFVRSHSAKRHASQLVASP